MVNAELSSAISVVAFVVFMALLFIGGIATLVRALRYSYEGQPWPSLLVRDLILVGGLGLDFLLILIARAFSLGPALAGNVLWVLLTSGLAIFSVGVYVYFELRVIERPPTKLDKSA